MQSAVKTGLFSGTHSWPIGLVCWRSGPVHFAMQSTQQKPWKSLYRSSLISLMLQILIPTLQEVWVCLWTKYSKGNQPQPTHHYCLLLMYSPLQINGKSSSSMLFHISTRSMSSEYITMKTMVAHFSPSTQHTPGLCMGEISADWWLRSHSIMQWILSHVWGLWRSLRSLNLFCMVICLMHLQRLSSVLLSTVWHLPSIPFHSDSLTTFHYPWLKALVLSLI